MSVASPFVLLAFLGIAPFATAAGYIGVAGLRSMGQPHLKPGDRRLIAWTTLVALLLLMLACAACAVIGHRAATASSLRPTQAPSFFQVRWHASRPAHQSL